MTKKRDPIPGDFTILVVPAADVMPHGVLTVPKLMRVSPSSAEDGFFRVIADSTNNDVGACFWALGKRREKLSAQLRAMADFLDKYGPMAENMWKKP